jgi:hypothetical protein
MAFNSSLDRVLSGVVDTVINLDLFAYRCSLKTTAKSADNYGGQTTGSVTTHASDLPLKFKDLKTPMTKTVGEKVTIIGTHLLSLRADADTNAITPDYEIHVEALGSEPARIFVRPVIIKGSFTHLVKVAAVLKS